MFASIELTPRHAEALADLERTTGKKQADLIVHALENYIEQQQEYAELVAEVARADADFAAGRVYSSAEVMANAMSAIAKVRERAQKDG